MLHDQFYTKKEVSRDCYKILSETLNLEEFNFDIYLEPSAGKGSFLELFPEDKRIGLDIDPKNSEVIKQDFFEYIPQANKRYITIGNPPFGKVCSLAIRFFNKAAEFSDIIAFIIPRTFKRVSVQNKLNLNFHLLYNKDLSLKPCCFEPAMNAKCCFQIWVKKDYKRIPIIFSDLCNDFEILNYGPKDSKNQPTPPTNADFAVLAYGGQVGRIVKSGLENLRPKSYHFIKVKGNMSIDTLITRIKSLDFSISEDTVRQNSIGKSELFWLYKNAFSEI